MENITLGDLADIEDATGISLVGIDLTKPPMKVALALAWILRRKSDPSFTYEQARNLPVSAVGELTKSLNPTQALPEQGAASA